MTTDSAPGPGSMPGSGTPHWRSSIVGYGEEDPAQLLAHPGNPKIHPGAQQRALDDSMGRLGWLQTVTVNKTTGHLLDGHARVGLAISKGEALVPVTYVEIPEDLESLALMTIDPTGSMAVYDPEAVQRLIDDIGDTGSEAIDAMLAHLAHAEGLAGGDGGGADGGGSDDEDGEDARVSLVERFVVPPFSVLDARQGYWQDRKRAWIALGIQSELGRGGNALGLSAAADEYRENRGDYSKAGTVQPVGAGGMADGLVAKRQQERARVNVTPGGSGGGSVRPATKLGANGRTQRGDGYGRAIVPGGGGNPETTAWLARGAGGYEAAPGSVRGRATATAYQSQSSLDELQGGESRTGTSIFDPVLCEIAYSWFCPPGGRVLDPFAGGSVRGVVASRLGRVYAGIDLRAEQVEANRAQYPICTEPLPAWHVGDSTDLGALLAPDDAFDLVFTCPPYADLEVYSDDPRDLSTMDYPVFRTAYRRIIRAALDRLRDDRFAVVVVSDVRDERGLYRNFVSDTIAAFTDAGAALYNEAILVTAVGSLPIRTGRQFSAGRKLGRSHQNVLVFVKGDPKRATEACGPVEVYVPDEAEAAGAAAGTEDDGDSEYD